MSSEAKKKAPEPAYDFDPREVAVELFQRGKNWREIWAGLKERGVREPQAKHLAKEVNTKLRGR